MISTPSSRPSLCYHGHWFCAKSSSADCEEGDTYEHWRHIIIELLHALSFVVFLKIVPVCFDWLHCAEWVMESDSSLWGRQQIVSKCEGSHAALVALNSDYCFALPAHCFSKIIFQTKHLEKWRKLISINSYLSREVFKHILRSPEITWVGSWHGAFVRV